MANRDEAGSAQTGAQTERQPGRHHQHAGYPGRDRNGARRAVPLRSEQEAGCAMAKHHAGDCESARTASRCSGPRNRGDRKRAAGSACGPD
jgi:hypothetical protein